MYQFAVAQKGNLLSLYSLHTSVQGAREWIEKKAPACCAQGHFSSKHLKPSDFVAVELTDSQLLPVPWTPS
jgi:hypothetical protein